MAMTLGSEFALFFHVDERLTYTSIEKALTDAGLDNVTIMRNPSGDGYDVQLIVRGDNNNERLDAVETVSAVADALEALGTEPEPEPEPEPSPSE